ncbi:hypothetical protein HQ571_00990 [Candidatus Kuenenbacteria bacterium]|nr:hypothetical protein [Candidatus Kuenenbacteria bacterium]
MQDDKWHDILDRVKEQFEIQMQETEPHSNIERGQVETVIFESPIGRIKLVRTTTPRVLDKKTIYSARAGSDMNVQYEYSKTEYVHDLKIFKWDDVRDDWVNARFEI